MEFGGGKGTTSDAKNLGQDGVGCWLFKFCVGVMCTGLPGGYVDTTTVHM
jgi:hypothetical protein